VEQGAGLMYAVAGARLHDQVVPNATFAEAWSAGASFYVSQQELDVSAPKYSAFLLSAAQNALPRSRIAAYLGHTTC
jgi:hypothetical protein